MISYRQHKRLVQEIEAAKRADEHGKYAARLKRLLHELQFAELLTFKVPKAIAALKAFDDSHAKLLKLTGSRTRGDRTKLNGAVNMEGIACDIVHRRTLDLKIRGMTTNDAKDQAIAEIAPHFGVSKSTLEYWIMGKAAAQRMKPVAERQYRKRKARKVAKAI